MVELRGCSLGNQNSREEIFLLPLTLAILPLANARADVIYVVNVATKTVWKFTANGVPLLYNVRR